MNSLTKRILLVVAILSAPFAATLLTRATDEVTRLEPGEIAETVIARGFVIAADGISEVRTQLDGQVRSVRVREGDPVKRGDLLAELDGRELELAVAQARAEAAMIEANFKGLRRGSRPAEQRQLSAMLHAAEQQLRAAEREAERQDELLGQGATSTRALQQARALADGARADLEVTQTRLDLSRGGYEIKSAEHRLEAALAAVELARASADKSKIVAPIDGVVLTRQVDPGDVVRSLDGRTLFEIADVSRLEVRVELEEGHVDSVPVGAKVTLTDVGGSKQLGSGRVVRLGAAVSGRAKIVEPTEMRADGPIRNAYVASDASGLGHLLLGQRIEARIELGKRKVATRAPRAAVQIRDGRAFVTVAQGLLRREITVRLGRADPTYVELEGVDPGERVIVRK